MAQMQPPQGAAPGGPPAPQGGPEAGGPPQDGGPEGGAKVIAQVLAVLEKLVQGMPPEILDQFKGQVMQILGEGGEEQKAAPGQGQAQMPPEQAGNPNMQPTR